MDITMDELKTRLPIIQSVFREFDPVFIDDLLNMILDDMNVTRRHYGIVAVTTKQLIQDFLRIRVDSFPTKIRPKIIEIREILQEPSGTDSEGAGKIRKIRNKNAYGVYVGGKLQSIHPTKKHALFQSFPSV